MKSRRLTFTFICLSSFDLCQIGIMISFFVYCRSCIPLFFRMFSHEQIDTTHRFLSSVIKLWESSIVFEDVCAFGWFTFFSILTISIWVLGIRSLFYQIERASVCHVQLIPWRVHATRCCHRTELRGKETIIRFYLHFYKLILQQMFLELSIIS